MTPLRYSNSVLSTSPPAILVTSIAASAFISIFTIEPSDILPEVTAPSESILVSTLPDPIAVTPVLFMVISPFIGTSWGSSSSLPTIIIPLAR